MSEAISGLGTPGRGDSEGLAIRIFEFIVADVDRIIQFLNVTGLQPETLRESANTPHFLLGVLDYVSKDDELLKLIHKDLGIPPDAILSAAGHLAPKPDPVTQADKKPEQRTQLPRRSMFR
ncbi:DUF3572 domain-containing protein [Microvirga sp. VF16]|uniref:DUF3572 domain-containing protein n=1 Tax=Microvirga sp. VF16 TaxID=2807101 RepID=UPI00193CF7CE|nr:DUF3572 domain-containing protein [Microvirga sp. VF16]QRM34893.1 DUF3572 domain-containing protein [Microvirga sp. VF16]